MGKPGKENNKRMDDVEPARTADLSAVRLETGTQVGQFRIEREIGRGGAGVVYLAHDTKLDRKVAIKSLPPELMRDAPMRSRLKREAKLLASLDHPNIATIHDIVEQEESGGYLILEYIEGDTLAERLAHRPLDLREVLSIAQQVAEAVAAAHEHGVTHRDLKPGNIKITPEGKVKVLDFGLAKAVAGEAADQESTITEPGRVMGTPAYMSPEQARGTETDKRCDIWSFGCVLYEMLTGKVPFEGQTASDTLAGILEREPNWSALPPTAPANIRVLLRRCLEKDPRSRLRDIGDAGIEIHETLTRPATASVETHPSHPTFWKVAGVWACVGLVLGAIAVLVVIGRSMTPSEPRSARRYWIRLDPNNPIAPAVDPISGYTIPRFTPDGRQLIYLTETGGDTCLVRRPIDSLDARAQRIPGTEGAKQPQVSPDGQWLAFSKGMAIYKIPLVGGQAEKIDSSWSGSFVWEDENTLILGTKKAGEDGLSRFDLRTKESETLTTFDETRDYTISHLPIEFHAESRTLFFVATGVLAVDDSGLFTLSLKGGRPKFLVKGAFGGYAPSGHVIYTQPGRLMAAPFDIKTLQKTGQDFPITEARMATNEMLISFSFSEDGALVYVPTEGTKRLNRTLVWVDREGKEQPLPVAPKPYEYVRISSDPTRPQIAAKISGDPRIYLHDGDNASRIHPLTSSSDEECYYWPVWVPPDDREVVFMSMKPPNRCQLKRKTVDGSGGTAVVSVKPSDRWRGFIPCFCTPDGGVLLAAAYPAHKENAKWDVVLIHLDRDGEIEYLPESHTNAFAPALSPDGEWLAYVAEEQGRDEVFVSAWPDAKKGEWQITTTGGAEPIWAPNGKTLYYRDRYNASFMAVPISIDANGTPHAGRPEVLFRDEYLRPEGIRTYDIDPNGTRFLMIKEPQEQVPITDLVVVENWLDELKRRAPTSSSR